MSAKSIDFSRSRSRLAFRHVRVLTLGPLPDVPIDTPPPTPAPIR